MLVGCPGTPPTSRVCASLQISGRAGAPLPPGRGAEAGPSVEGWAVRLGQPCMVFGGTPPTSRGTGG